MSKSGLKAFFLGLIPGMGHMYMRKFTKGFIYSFIVLTILMIGVFSSIVSGDGMPFFLSVGFALFVWFISMFDLIITILRARDMHSDPMTPHESAPMTHTERASDNVSSATIALSFIPGLGHMHMGLAMRGLTFLVAFFGILTMVFFISALSGESYFIIFLGALPVIWIYNLFDAMQLYNRKQRGETLQDKTIFEELEEQRESGKKSKALSMFLAILPGAGHMYLGLQRRGLQLMAAFLLAIYILDVLRLSLFLFIIPLIWFFSFFDALQQASRFDSGNVKDVPIVEWLINHQRWVGIALLLLGTYYILDQVALPVLSQYFPNTNFRYWYEQYLQTTVIALALVIGGIKLMAGSKKRGGGEQ